MCIPILQGGQVLGTMDFFSTERLHPSSERLEALRTVGALVSHTADQFVAAELAASAAADSAAVARVLAEVGETATVDGAAKVALDSVREAFGWAYGSYWRLDASDNLLHFLVDSGEVNAEFQAVSTSATFANGVGLSGRAWKRRDLVFVEDLSQVTDCVRAPVAARAGVKSGVCFPVTVDGEIMATIDFFSTETLHPTQERLDALRQIGVLVSQHISQLRLVERQAEAAADSEAVAKLLAKLAEAETADEAARVALDTVRGSFGWAYGSYWAVKAVDGLLHFAVESGHVSPEFQRVTQEATFAEGVGLSGRAWKQRELVFVDDLARVTDCVRAPVARQSGVRSGVCFPVTLDGNVVGTMDFFATETLHPSEERLNALRNVGRLVSQAFGRLEVDERERQAAAGLKAKVDSILEVVTAAAAGDLTQAVAVSGQDAIGQLGEGVAKLIVDLRSSLTQIGQSADTLAGASEELSATSSQLVANAEQSYTQSQGASSALEDIAGRVRGRRRRPRR